jgi:hypothetical protein
MKRRLKRVMDRGSDHVPDRSDFAVALATLQAAPKPKPKLRPVDTAARFAIEKALQRRRYCNAFALWRICWRKTCRRARACRGDANACLKQALARVPREVQWRARQDVLDRTPRNIGAPERKARQCMPADLYE